MFLHSVTAETYMTRNTDLRN